MGEIGVASDSAAAMIALLAERGVPARVVERSAEMAGVEILLADPKRALSLLDGPDLRWVQATWAGVDALPLAYLPESVTLTRLTDVFGPQMTEFVFGWLLARTQRVAVRSRADRWDPTTPGLLRGTTLGIMGSGSIGSALARTGTHLGMRVRGLSRSGSPVDGFDRVWPVEERFEFAHGVHHLVVALPSTPATSRLVDADLLDRLSPAATLVNVGRGRTVDTAAVVAALGRHKLSMAVLDVLPVEPLVATDPLWSVPGLVITSHTAAWSRPVDVVGFFAGNLERYRSGEPLRGAVDRTRGY